MKKSLQALSAAALMLFALQLTLAVPAAGQAAGLDGVERLVLPRLDERALRRADEQRVAWGNVPHFAVAHEVEVSPWNHGTWERLGEGYRWRLLVVSEGAFSLNLAFSRYRMPAGGQLTLTSPDGRHRAGPFTEGDNEEHGELWTPPLSSDELLLELRLPEESLDDLELELTKVHHGYAGFGAPPPKSGQCHVDVSCSEAEPWSDQARSVALISIEGVRFCTGFLVNNTALDGRPFLITAAHCGVRRNNAASLVVLWSHQRSTCGVAAADPAPLRFQTGAMLRAAYRGSDVVLVELDDPPAAEFDVYYAGWDRSPADPERSVAIHHPNTDVKRIAFDFDRATTTGHLGDRAAAGGNHLRIGQWDTGTTEGGSSGAPLFNADRRVVGQLHGGYAACGDHRPDWFGRFSNAWDGGGHSRLRLRDWLDPLGTEAMALDGLDGTAVDPSLTAR